MDQCDESCEPMDVDISFGSELAQNASNPKLLDDEFSTSEVLSPKSEMWNIKKFHLKKKTEKKSRTTYKIILSLFGICVAVIVYQIMEIKCIEKLDLNDIEIKLRNNVHDQTEAITSLLNGLSMDVSSKLLFMYGGTGVGKTYTTSILLSNLWNSSNVYHYTMPTFVNAFSLESMFGLNICKSSIVVVDDLKREDVSVVSRIMKQLFEKSENLNKKITVILVCNCDRITKDLLKTCDEDFMLNVKTIFDDFKVLTKFIKYEPLTEDTIRKCIQDELGSWRIDNLEMNNLLKNFNVSLDGCKGVHRKIKFLNL